MKETEFKAKNAVMFFFCASFALYMLFYIIQYVGRILEFLIAMISGLQVGVVIEEILVLNFAQKVFPLTGKSSELQKYKVPLFGDMNWVESSSTVSGFVVAFAWFFSKNWVLNNILGISMCYVFLKSLRLNQLLPGILLLCLLFCYDVFWVFYSPIITGGKSVMIEVATGFDAPIKILMPHISLRDYPTSNCSLLGLGDIVIPGIFIGFLIRFGR